MCPMANTEERDHVDRWLEDAWLEDMPFLDLEVEAIVDRVNGLNRRIRRSQNTAIAEQGLTFEEWGARSPEQLRLFRADGVTFAWPGGESGHDIAARTAAEIDWLVARHRDEPGAVCVVSHGGALAWSIVHLLREPGDRWPREHMRIANCAVSEVEIDPDRWLAGEPATFLCRNEVGHLTVEESAEAVS